MRRELALRENSGIQVALIWDMHSDTLAVTVAEPGSGESFELVVDPEEALDAFYHPFAYASFRGVDYPEPAVAAMPWHAPEA